MKSIILATSLSETLLRVILKEQNTTAGDTLVIDLDDKTHNALKEYGVGSLALRPSVATDWGKRDSRFRDLALPGKQLGVVFPGTNLPIYKALGMDRLSFWYLGEYADKSYEYLAALRWEAAFVCSDLNTPLGWALAKHSGRRVVAVKTGSLRTREWHDFLRSGCVPFHAIIVEKESDRKFLIDNGYLGEVSLA